MSEKSQAVYYISSCHMLIDKALSSDKPNGHWFEADWLHCKRDALSSNRKVHGSRLTGSTQACQLSFMIWKQEHWRWNCVGAQLKDGSPVVIWIAG